MGDKKILLAVFDGVGDRPVAELGGKTPLQAAKKPNLNLIAKNGCCGLMDSISVGIRPGSDTSHLALLGYDPYEVYTGRGPFEAIGIGLDVASGDIAFRCNFSTVDDKYIVKDRRAGRISQGTVELAKALDGQSIDGVKVIFRAGVEHRAVLVLRGSNLSAKISDPDPHKEGVKPHDSAPLASETDAKQHADADKTAKILNKFVKMSYDVLKDHPVNKERVKRGENPANIVMPRGSGVVPHIQKFEERNKIKGKCVAGIPLVKGVCKFVGLEAVDVPGATGALNTNMNAKADAVIKAFDTCDFVLMNIKAPDLCGHDGNGKEKVKVVERIDEAMGRIYKAVGDRTVIAITGDHSTPVSVKDHSADPLPLAIYAKWGRVDSVSEFDEMSVSHGCLHRIQGKGIIPIMLDLAGYSEKFGA